MRAPSPVVERLDERLTSTFSRAPQPRLAAVNGANVAAGLTASLFYTFGAVPLFLAAAADLGLSPAAMSSWFFIIFFTSGAFSIVASLRYRQPLAIGWAIPGIVFLATNADRYSLAEMAGAGIIAGLAMVGLGCLGLGERLTRWLPLPIVMGVFAGSVLGYVSGIFAHFQAQPWVVGAALVGYLGARAFGRAWLPPVGGAVATGLAAALVAGQVHVEGLRWSPPVVEPVWPIFSLTGALALALPLLVMSIGIGNVQSIGVLVSQGYRPPIRLLTVLTGVMTIVNAVFGGHAATLQRNGVAILAGDEAGPRPHRYVASLIASAYALALAFAASAAGALPGVLPSGLVAALAGLAILAALLDALKRTVETDLPMGAFFALIIAASPLTLLGVGSAFWALVGGLAVSLLLERRALARAWRAGDLSRANDHGVRPDTVNRPSMSTDLSPTRGRAA
jgi:benzoate membrane transport protein